MTTEPTQLAAKIAVYIAKNHPVDYETLEARAKTHGVPIAAFVDAMTIIHRSKSIEAKSTAHGIVYTVTVAKAPAGPASHLLWLRDNYPPMTSENDGSGIEVDYSYLFLSPGELEKFKAEVRGVAYVPSKRYRKSTV